MAWGERAITLAEDGHHAEALADFERSLALNPNEPGTLIEMGKSLVRLNRAEEAVEVFRKAIELNDGIAEGWHQLALALAELDRPGAAEFFAQVDQETLDRFEELFDKLAA